MESSFVFVGNHCDDKIPWCTAPTKIILSETNKNSMRQIIREAIKKTVLFRHCPEGEGSSTLAQMFLEHCFRGFIFGQNVKGGGVQSY